MTRNPKNTKRTRIAIARVVKNGANELLDPDRIAPMMAASTRAKAGGRRRVVPGVDVVPGDGPLEPLPPAVVAGYEALGRAIGALVDTKQAAYGDSFGKSGDVMRVLYPNGIAVEQMDDALALVRILDKMFRIATNRDALGESPYRDVAGYALLGAKRVEHQRAAARPVGFNRDGKRRAT